MKINWITITIIIISLVFIALTIFLIKQNQKDKKAFMKKLNDDYQKPIEHISEIDSED